MTEEQEPVQLCWGQQWSWQQQELPPDRRSPSLMFTHSIELPDVVSVTAVRDAVRLVAARHAALRSTVTVGADRLPRQAVWPVETEAYALECFDDADRGHLWLRESPDILSVWPLRVAVLRCGPDRTRIGIAAHHIATDRYGFDLLCRELHAALRAVTTHVALALPVPGRQPADIAAFERSADGVATNERAVAYWLGHHDELDEELGILAARFEEPSAAMHVAQAISADAAMRLSRLATAARSSEAAVAVAAVAGMLAGYLGRSSVLMFTTSANRHLAGVRHSVCSLAQAGLVRIGVPDPRRLGHLIPAAGKGTLTAARHAYFDGNVLAERQRAASGTGHHVAVTPPSVNVMRLGEFAPRLPSGWDPGSDGLPFVRAERVDRPCSGLNFHVQLAESHLSVELRAGTHLLSAADCQTLVAGAMELILSSD